MFFLLEKTCKRKKISKYVGIYVNVFEFLVTDIIVPSVTTGSMIIIYFINRCSSWTYNFVYYLDLYTR